MWRILLLATVLLSRAAAAHEPAVLAAWLQHGPQGLELRAVVDGPGCPTMTVTPRGPSPQRVGGFGGKGLCVADLAGATAVRLPGRRLPAIPTTIERIVVIGDTGCRRETGKEPCDPSHWPFAAVAKAASREHAQLVIHVGDYFYRDFDCPHAADPAVDECDTWQTWKTDFFDHARPLLAEAPWLFIRGNHEDCFGRP